MRGESALRPRGLLVMRAQKKKKPYRGSRRNENGDEFVTHELKERVSDGEITAIQFELTRMQAAGRGVVGGSV